MSTEIFKCRSTLRKKKPENKQKKKYPKQQQKHFSNIQ